MLIGKFTRPSQFNLSNTNSRTFLLKDKPPAIDLQGVTEKIKDLKNNYLRLLEKQINGLPKERAWCIRWAELSKLMHESKSYQALQIPVLEDELPVPIVMLSLIMAKKDDNMDKKTAELLQLLSGTLISQERSESRSDMEDRKVGYVRTLATVVFRLAEMEALAKKNNEDGLVEKVAEIRNSDSIANTILSKRSVLRQTVGYYIFSLSEKYLVENEEKKPAVKKTKPGQIPEPTLQFK